VEESHGIEVVGLLAATLYAFILPFKGDVSLINSVILAGIFAFYIWRISRVPAQEPDLVGPARLIGELSPYLRRALTVIMTVRARRLSCQ
jgi:cation:H+ antiporter